MQLLVITTVYCYQAKLLQAMSALSFTVLLLLVSSLSALPVRRQLSGGCFSARDNLTASLNVMRAVTSPPQLGFLPLLLNPQLPQQLARVCQVLDFTSAVLLAEAAANDSSEVGSEQSTLLAETIQNRTCNWVKAHASSAGLENCSPEELQLFCIKVQLFLHTTAADETLPTSHLDKCDWVEATFSGDVLQHINDAVFC